MMVAPFVSAGGDARLPFVDDLAVLGGSVLGERHRCGNRGMCRRGGLGLLHMFEGVPAPGVDMRAGLEADEAGLDRAGMIRADGGDYRASPKEQCLDVDWVNRGLTA